MKSRNPMIAATIVVLTHPAFAAELAAPIVAQRAETPPSRPPASAPATAPVQTITKSSKGCPAELMDTYYLRTCAVCSGLLGARGEALTIARGGRELRICCNECRVTFERDPIAGLARVDSTMIADQLPYYPTKASLFDDRPLGERPIDFMWGNRLFRAVDAAERDKILADPAVAVRALDQKVLDDQGPKYGMLDKCPVQGDILPTDREVDFVVANRMVRVCCVRCVSVIRARPSQYLGMIEYANREAARRREQNADSAP